MNTPIKTIIASICIAIIAFLFELFVFNYHSIESLFFNDASVTCTNLEKYDYSPDSSAFKFKDVNRTLEFSCDAQSIQSIRFSHAPDAKVAASVFAIDDGNSLWYKLGTINFHTDGYMRIHPYGNVYGLKIAFEPSEISSVYIRFNAKCHPEFNLIRYLLTLGCLILLWALRKKSLLWRSASTKRFTYGCAVFASIVIIAGVSYCQQSYSHDYAHHHQYHELAVALTKGHVYLDETPSDNLLALDNPYDTALRNSMKVEVQHDHAFFKGKYYVYFGILPAILFYLPYYLLCGGEWPNYASVAISLCAFAFGLAYLIRALSKSNRLIISKATFGLAYLVALTGSCIAFAIHYPDLYVVPITLGMALTAWGLAFWIEAISSNAVSIPFGIAGSICMALVLLCRPQLVIVSGIGIVMLVCYRVFHHGSIKPKDIFLILMPYFFIACLAGFYNLIRFGSLFDFGASYNLTTNDMTHRTASIDQIVQGLFVYLGQPPAITLESPFIHATDHSASYYGTIISESTYGGIFMICPITLLLILIATRIPWAKLNESSAVMRAYAVSFAFMGIVLAGFDAVGAGLLQRYYLDFGLPLGIASSILVLMLCGITHENHTNISVQLNRSLCSALMLAGLIFQIVLYSTAGYP